MRQLYPQYILEWLDDLKGVPRLGRNARSAWKIVRADDTVVEMINLGAALPDRIKKFDDALNSSLWNRAYARYLSLLVNTCNYKGSEVRLRRSFGNRPFELRTNRLVRTVTPVSAAKDLPSLHDELRQLFERYGFGVYLLGKTDKAGAKRIGAECFYPNGWNYVPWYAPVDMSIDFEWFRPVPARTRSVPHNARLFTDPRVAAQTIIGDPAIPAFRCVQCGQEERGFYHNNLDTFTCVQCRKVYFAPGMEREILHGVKLVYSF